MDRPPPTTQKLPKNSLARLFNPPDTTQNWHNAKLSSPCRATLNGPAKVGLVGVLDGVIVGVPDGVIKGRLVLGLSVGLLDGGPVGLPVGVPVGLSEALIVGVPVGVPDGVACILNINMIQKWNRGGEETSECIVLWITS